jgi:hypothetical protein
MLASMGEKLNDAELAVFRKLTQRERPPSSMVRELWAVVGRRGGKSRARILTISDDATMDIRGLASHEQTTSERNAYLVAMPRRPSLFANESPLAPREKWQSASGLHLMAAAPLVADFLLTRRSS